MRSCTELSSAMCGCLCLTFSSVAMADAQRPNLHAVHPALSMYLAKKPVDDLSLGLLYTRLLKPIISSEAMMSPALPACSLGQIKIQHDLSNMTACNMLPARGPCQRLMPPELLRYSAKQPCSRFDSHGVPLAGIA